MHKPHLSYARSDWPRRATTSSARRRPRRSTNRGARDKNELGCLLLHPGLVFGLAEVPGPQTPALNIEAMPRARRHRVPAPGRLSGRSNSSLSCRPAKTGVHRYRSSRKVWNRGPEGKNSVELLGTGHWLALECHSAADPATITGLVGPGGPRHRLQSFIVLLPLFHSFFLSSSLPLTHFAFPHGSTPLRSVATRHGAHRGRVRDSPPRITAAAPQLPGTSRISQPRPRNSRVGEAPRNPDGARSIGGERSVVLWPHLWLAGRVVASATKFRG